MCPFETPHLYPLDKYLVVQLLGRTAVLFLLFPRWLHQPAFPPTMQKRSSVSASSPTSVVAWIAHVSPSGRCEGVSHCGFALYFPDDEWCRAFFHVSVGHLDVFFGEVSIHVFCLFLHWIICFLGVEFNKLFIDFGYHLYLIFMSFANIFSHFVNCLLVYWLFPSLCRSFLFWWGSNSSPLLLFPLPPETRSCCSWGQTGFCWLSPRGFWWLPVLQWGLSSILSLFLCMVQDSGPGSFFCMSLSSFPSTIC